MKKLIGWKAIMIAWIILGTVALIIGVTKLTFACVWLLYLSELWANMNGQKEDQTDKLLDELEIAASDAWADMGIDDSEKDAIYDDGRHQGLTEAIKIVKEVTNYGETES